MSAQTASRGPIASPASATRTQASVRFSAATSTRAADTGDASAHGAVVGGTIQYELPTQGEPVEDMPKVMIFDTAGSTYLCILKEGMQGAKEFYRISGEDQWLTVDRTDKTRSALYEDAGVPKTIPWSGPTVVVYTHGKLDAEHGDAPKSLSFLPLSLSSPPLSLSACMREHLPACMREHLPACLPD